ncbi:MAG: TonB family protein [Woeseiaceae bacterium]|nr:TonB family protein [Woeseiaceae bacterium]
MPLDQFKTQVLLLHSEQSTLDSLSSGFSDSYTVHCATSGTEGLATLGETPINVIISAQDLPGMSGVEALREAKKRSPDTIGILLAGSSGESIEALVGDQEVFQVVTGDVTGDGLLKLVESATQQMRLMALAESANDTTANPDVPASAEHIVMETADNGSTIISDGTGRLPALNPEKVAAAAAIGAQSVDVLVLTKDQEFLTTIKESSRGMHTVHYASTLKQADDTIRTHKVGVAVVDAAMVGEKIEQLTQHLRKGSPRLVSVVAGRRDDGEMLMDLINRGKVYRFLLKPVSPGRARLAVEASVKHHLEAPDSAFKAKTAPAGATPKPAAKSAPKPVAKPKPKPRKKPKPVAKAPPPVEAPADPPLGDLEVAAPADDNLSTAFGGNDSKFTETMTGLIDTVSKKFKGTEKDDGPMESALDLPAPAESGGTGGSLLGQPAVIGGAAVVAVALIGSLFWLLGGDEEPVEPPAPTATTVEETATSTPPISETEPEFIPPAPAPVEDPAAGLVEEARLARDAGQIFNPQGNNAIELFAAALEANPSDAEIAAEYDAVIGEALSMAETALLDGRINDAEVALDRVALADPDNNRLPFLTAQLSQIQLRSYLVDARAAIRETRFEDAANAIDAARALGVTDMSEINTVADELSAARSAQRVDEVLALASARVEEGALLAPANDNARYFYELVLSNDPGNVAAQQGLDVVASRLVLQARSEIDTGNLDAADSLLTDARAVNSTNADLAGAELALQGARDAIIEAQQRAEAEARAEAERQATQARLEAERQAALDALAAQQAQQEEAAAAEPESPVVDATSDAMSGNDTLATNDGAAYGPELETPMPQVAGSTASLPEPTPVETPVDVRDQTPVPASTLTRTRFVAPKFPRAAQRRGTSGWVDIVFTVGIDGSVKDIDVLASSPKGVFDSAAVQAVEKWTFEPSFDDGVLVEKRAGSRLVFALE